MKRLYEELKDVRGGLAYKKVSGGVIKIGTFVIHIKKGVELQIVQGLLSDLFKK